MGGENSLSVAVLVGPEGGWSDGEREAAHAAGYVSAGLGRLILRAETAAVAALSVLSQSIES